MYHPPSKKVRFVRKFIVLAIMTAAVVSGAVILAAMTLGYRFTPGDGGKLQQGGIMQLDSKPAGATVTINGTQYGSRTPTKLTSQAGDYTVTMERDGYLPWQKTVPITTGGISWVTYPRLIPKERKPESVVDYSPTVASALSSASSKYYAVLESQGDPTVSLVRLDGEEVRVRTVTLPEDHFTSPEPEQSLSRFAIEKWTGDEKRLLLSHTYGDNTKEWILMDIDRPDESVNITNHLGISSDMRSPKFSVNDGTEVYAIIDGDVRIIDLDRQTLSRPIVQNATHFSLYGNGYVLFTQQSDDNMQHVGYVKESYREPRIIDTLETTYDEPAQLSVGKYFDKYYFLIANGSKAELSSSTNMPDNSTAKLERTHEKTLELDGTITDSNITDNGQLATIQDGESFSTYNLELKQLSLTKIVNTASPSTQTLQHLDRYMFWGVNDGQLRTYEFDGENQHDIMAFDYRLGATLSPNGKYIYALAADEDGEKVSLTRVRMMR